MQQTNDVSVAVTNIREALQAALSDLIAERSTIVHQLVDATTVQDVERLLARLKQIESDVLRIPTVMTSIDDIVQHGR